ncbi:MAG TPA: RsmG family class I SAM-dependent methyltransferase [Polyangiaceae bacterium]|jgi:16S rRNA (guanine527-N7)-methyltransferase
MTANTVSLAPLVDRATSSLGARVDAGVRANLLTWLDRLRQWNARIDLTAARSPEELVDLMLADALILAPRLGQGARVVDVGAGAGAPGLGLALLRADLRLTLVEPLGKRASFLRTVVGEVGRADVAIERVRGEALAGRRAWDVAVSRATLSPAGWLDLGTTLAAPGGSVWVLLAKEEAPATTRARLEEDVAYTWPLTGAARRAARYLVVS